MQSTFNKKLGPDCIDGNLVSQNEKLGAKVTQEITDALNNCQIPDSLKIGRLIPLQKTLTNGPCGQDEIRPIVVRSHISKIMEKQYLRGSRPRSCISSPLKHTRLASRTASPLPSMPVAFLMKYMGKRKESSTCLLTSKRPTTRWTG
jgi:hypothetical protein